MSDDPKYRGLAVSMHNPNKTTKKELKTHVEGVVEENGVYSLHKHVRVFTSGTINHQSLDTLTTNGWQYIDTEYCIVAIRFSDGTMIVRNKQTKLDKVYRCSDDGRDFTEERCKGESHEEVRKALDKVQSNSAITASKFYGLEEGVSLLQADAQTDRDRYDTRFRSIEKSNEAYKMMILMVFAATMASLIFLAYRGNSRIEATDAKLDKVVNETGTIFGNINQNLEKLHTKVESHDADIKRLAKTLTEHEESIRELIVRQHLTERTVYNKSGLIDDGKASSYRSKDQDSAEVKNAPAQKTISYSNSALETTEPRSPPKESTWFWSIFWKFIVFASIALSAVVFMAFCELYATVHDKRKKLE